MWGAERWSEVGEGLRCGQGGQRGGGRSWKAAVGPVVRTRAIPSAPASRSCVSGGRVTPQVSPCGGREGCTGQGFPALLCLSAGALSPVVGVKIRDDGRGKVLKLTSKESITFRTRNRGCWLLACVALLWGQRSPAGSCEHCVRPRGFASHVTFCCGRPGHRIPFVAQVTAAGDTPRKDTLSSLRVFLFIFST